MISSLEGEEHGEEGIWENIIEAEVKMQNQNIDSAQEGDRHLLKGAAGARVGGFYICYYWAPFS